MNLFFILTYLSLNLWAYVDNTEIPAWKSYNFKLQIKKGTEECFYEPVVKGSLLYISFQVKI